MAKLEVTIKGKLKRIIKTIEEGIVEGSVSASLEDSSDFKVGDAKCSVRVFERYSYMGGNRVSMSVTFFQCGNSPVHISAITSGGSQAMFFKINTLGEEAFLDKLREILDVSEDEVLYSDADGDRLPQVKCKKCGKEHDFDYPKCPYCNYEEGVL